MTTRKKAFTRLDCPDCPNAVCAACFKDSADQRGQTIINKIRRSYREWWDDEYDEDEGPHVLDWLHTGLMCLILIALVISLVAWLA